MSDVKTYPAESKFPDNATFPDGTIFGARTLQKPERPTVARLCELFELRADGTLVWKRTSSNRAPAGSVAGSAHSEGYRVLAVDGAPQFAHRVVWAIAHGRWPEGQIDHINGARADNRPENLREVANRANSQNRTRLSRRNTSGLQGVYWHRAGEKWAAEATHPDGQKAHLGLFTDPLKAHAAVDAYRRQHYAGYVPANAAKLNTYVGDLV